MAKLPRQPKSFKQMRAEKTAGMNVYGGNRQYNNPNIAYRAKPRINSVDELRAAMTVDQARKQRKTESYTTPEGAYMSPEYIDNLDNSKVAGEGKGLKGENCNRTACQAPGAHWFNHSTRAYYCKTCADVINRSCARDSFVEGLGHPLLTLDPDFVDKYDDRGWPI